MKAFKIAGLLVSLLLANDSLLINLPADSWYEVPNTKMSGIMYKPVTTGIMNAWSGGVFDPLARRMLVWGGGAGNYPYNELDAFSIDSLKWTRLTEPCVNYGCCDPDPCGTPMVRHSYSGMAFITHANRFFVNGGAKNCYAQVCPNNRTGDGVTLNKTWTFDMATNSWELMYRSEASLDTVLSSEGDGPGGVATTCSYDSVTGLVFYASSVSGTFTYNYDTNVWTKISSDRTTDQNSCIDTKRRRLVRLGNDGQNWDHHVAVLDLTKPGFPKTNYLTTGTNNIITRQAPGLDYDPVADKYVCWRDTNVYTLDPDTWVWTKHSGVGAPPATPHGIYGRWRYIPSVNAFICITSEDKNVHFYKLTSRNGSSTSEKLLHSKSEKLHLTVSPNPFNPVTRVGVSGLTGNRPCLISLYNATGSKLHGAVVPVHGGTALYKLNGGKFATGLYVIRVEQGDKSAIKAVMLTR
ncbi:MAG: T9SS type A sorting domain-containing protein [Fibrobacteres bacterium]|nr:T9SS type A sorting domain-containing protein [Fibrobacterota bacterium]